MESVFSTLARYLKEIFLGIKSILETSSVPIPYLLGIGERRKKEVTEQYPDPVSSKTEDDLPPRSRGLLYNDIDRCTGCLDCEKICPVQCITIENEPGPNPNKKWVAVFDIDFGRCIFCGLCVEVCHPGSLIHTKQYEGAVYFLKDLETSFGRGRVTDEQREKWVRMRKAEELG